MRHVVWDWNGTLLDDLPLVVEAVNALMIERDLPLITPADYTAHYTRPVRVFYERLFGRPVEDDEWEHVDEVFHTAYDLAVRERPVLMDGTHEALDHVDATGRSQSLLSMYRHDPLVDLLGRMQLQHRFAHVQGLTGPGGGHKHPHLERHLVDVVHHAGDDPTQVLLIGDALDDAVAAHAVGARCVLLASGSHPVAELQRAGVPVVTTLSDALEAGGII